MGILRTMALHLPHSVFFHIPKTGGSWVRQAIVSSGVPANEIANFTPHKQGRELFTMYHNTPDDVHTEGLFTFSFVRNPLAYYQSYWSHVMRRKGLDVPKNPFNDQYMRSRFPDFVRAVCAGQPGWVSRIYARFNGIDGNRLSFVGRQESLVEDVVKALRLAGEQFDEAALRATPKQNLSSKLSQWDCRCTYTESLAMRIIETEAEAFSLYGYSTDPSAFLRQSEAVGSVMYA